MNARGSFGPNMFPTQISCLGPRRGLASYQRLEATFLPLMIQMRYYVVYLCVYIYIYTYVRMYACICIYIYICMGIALKWLGFGSLYYGSDYDAGLSISLK